MDTPTCKNCNEEKVLRTCGPTTKNAGKQFWTCKNDCANAFQWVASKPTTSVLQKRKQPEGGFAQHVNNDKLDKILEILNEIRNHMLTENKKQIYFNVQDEETQDYS